MGPLVETVLSNVLTSNGTLQKLDLEKTVGYLWVGLQNLFWIRFYLKKVGINVKSFFLEIVSETLCSCYYLTIIQRN